MSLFSPSIKYFLFEMRGTDDPFGARDEVLRLANGLGISITVGLAHQVAVVRSGEA